MRIQPATITEAPVDEEERHDTKNDPELKDFMFDGKIRQSI
jgi:hypothetical protein